MTKPISKLSLGLLLPLVLSAAPACALAEEYRLAPGDVLQLSIIGLPDVKQRSMIDPSGQVMLPLVGSVQAGGKSISALATEVKARFANKVIQQRGMDGRAVSTVLSTDEVTLDVLEYRPIYIRGDVSKPGELVFRPGITVRQAIAMSGGYDVVRLRTTNPVLETSQTKGELATLWAELVKYDAMVWRLRNETGQPSPIDKTPYTNAPISPQLVDAAFKVEDDQLKARRGERDREIAYLNVVIPQADRRLELLASQQKNETEGMKQDVEDFDRVSKLFEKGSVAVTRYSDARRSMLLSSTRILQTSAAISQLEREREELQRTLSGVDDKRRIVAFAELQEAQNKAIQTRAKIVAAQEHLVFSSKMRAQLGANGEQKVELALVRQTEKGRERMLAQEDTELRPGDSVEVVMDISEMLSFPN
jgi:polysaccharide export outer membrane protein